MTTEVEKLGLLFNKRIHKVYNSKNSPAAELGTINAGKRLKVASLNDTIPKSDYLVAESVEKLTKGDRVLVLWCGNDPVIAAVLKEGDS